MAAITGRVEARPAEATRERSLAASAYWLATVGLILVAFAIRTYDLDARSLWIDEGLTLYRATKDVAFILGNHIIIDGVVTTDLHPPLYFLLLHWFLDGAGVTPFMMRLFSVLVSLPSLPLLYLIGRRLGGRLTGLCAALVATLAPIYLWFGQEARPYTLLITFSLLSVYTLLRLIARDGSRANRLTWAAGYVLATAAMIYTHYSGLFILGFQALFVLVVGLGRRDRWLVAAVAGPAVLISPIIPFIVRRLGMGAEFAYSFVPLGTILGDLANSFALGLSVQADQVWWLDVLFLLIGLLGLAALAKAGRPGWSLWIVGYLAIPVLALYGASYIKPMYMAARHLLIISPAYYLALGAGLAGLARWRRPALMVGLAVILAGTGYSNLNYFTDPAYLKDDHRGLARYLEEHVRPGDVIVVDGPIRGHMVLDFYYDGPAPLVVVPPFGTQAGPQTLESLQALSKQYDRMWFAYGIPGDDWVDEAGQRPIHEWQQTLFRFKRTYFHGLGDSISVQGYLAHSPVLAELPNRATSIKVNLGTQLQLSGMELPADAIAAGNPLDVTLYWRARETLENYRVVLQLLDERGNEWGLSDQMPFEGQFPPSQWPLDKIVAWQQTLKIDPTTPPGRYTLGARVYAPATGETLNIIGTDGNPAGQLIELGAVTITRPATPPQLPSDRPPHRLKARWSGGVELVGYEQPVDTMALGDPVPLNLYFSAQAAPQRDLVLRLRLVDAAGQTATAVVASPVTEAYPTSQWQPGDVLMGQHPLRVPASASPGIYEWCLRLEDQSGTAVPVRQGWWPFAGTDACLGKLSVEAAPTVEAPAVIPHPLDATFGGQIRLLGYDLSSASDSSGAQPSEVAAQPGEPLAVKLFWRTEAPLTTSYKVTVQILSPEAQVVGQDDSIPAGWTRPTTGWRPQEIVVDEHTVKVDGRTSAGRYALIVALYDEQTGQRLPVTSAGGPTDRARLTDVVVKGE